MTSSVGTFGNVTAFQSAAVRPRRVLRSGCRPVAAVRDDRAHNAVQQAGKTLLAAAAAMTLSISTGPAFAAAPTFGIQKNVEKMESSYDAVLERLNSAFEASQKEASKISSAFVTAADSVSGVASKVASDTQPDGKKNSVPKATQQGGKAAQPADLKDEGLNAPNPSAAVKKASEEVKSSTSDTAQQANQQVSKYQEKAKNAQETPNSVGSIVDKAVSAVSGDDSKDDKDKGGIGGFFSQFTKGPKEAATDAIGSAATSAVVDAGKNLPSGAVDKVADKAGDATTSAVNKLVDQFK